MIQFNYAPTYADWRALNRHAILRQLWLLIAVASLVLFCYVVLPIAHRLVGRDVGVLATYRENLGVLWLPGIVAFVLVASFAAVHRRWKSVEELRLEKHYEIDESGVRVSGTSLSGFLEWKHFHSADYRGGYVFLRTHQNQFHYFPESALPDKRALFALVAENITVSRRWKRSLRS